MEILYTTNNEFGQAVFARRDEAHQVARIRRALNNATTWAEFKELMDPYEYQYLVEKNLGMKMDDIDLSEPFRPDAIPGVADRYYPTWLQARMLEWFPKSLILKYDGDITSLKGDALVLPGEYADEVADDLRSEGYTVARTDLSFL
ncbi:hypothetical protein [Tessaracoccus sp. ZS01]|uniref:hypothetical protein n=1 Tax=Tessaracoccus sp. ZS01 TaxID=1906324 RepID=UPI00096D19D1|nr:hypothetical protein [Tessaracoccus sp. ZS01]MCG6566884.1 hypothetical protein [Tessaracoccus sp. ZS01]OMG58015.1 hypothetical protein BJN44_04470 [Tessaracoccus sp. ZS01]